MSDSALQRGVDVDLSRRSSSLDGLRQLVAEFGLAREDKLLQVGERVVVRLVLAGEIATARTTAR
jgi:hypothetical protein